MIYLKKKVKNEKVMIVIKQSIVIVNMKPPPSPLKGEFISQFLGQLCMSMSKLFQAKSRKWRYSQFIVHSSRFRLFSYLVIELLSY